MKQLVLRHKDPYIIQGGFNPPILLCWYHDIDEPDLHVQHFIHGDFESAEVTSHVHFKDDYPTECEEVSWEDVPQVVQEEFRRVWSRHTVNPS